MNFTEKLLAATHQNQSLLCVGLDPEPGRLPSSLIDLPIEVAITRFCCEIIEATAPFVSAFKPNLAFFEVLGPKGMLALQAVVKSIPANIPIIADAKRCDIGNSARNYAAAIFDVYGCDAMTVNAYLGLDSVAPFLAYQDKGVLILCRNSNPGARDFQDLQVQGADGHSHPLYEEVARRVQSWNQFGNCGLVVGATYPQELATIRALCPDMPILIPGIGTQGGDLEASVRAGGDAHGERAILSVSRAILYADSGPHFAKAAAEQAQSFRHQMQQALKSRE